MAVMTFEEFVERVATRLAAAQARPMEDGPEIQATISWAAQVIQNSSQYNWQEKDVIAFLEAVGRRLGAIGESDKVTGPWLKRAQSNSAFMALMARADLLIQSTKGAR